MAVFYSSDSTGGFGSPRSGDSLPENQSQAELEDLEFGDYMITGKADSDRLFHKFMAIHLEQNQPAFIKVLRKEVAGGEGFQESFVQRLGHLRSLVHGSLVPILDGGIHKGQYFVVEEKFEGFALGRGLDNEHFEHDDKIRVVRQMGQALSYLHQEGIVHGEFSPAHVFITVEDLAKINGYGFPELIRLKGYPPPILNVDRRRFASPEVLANSSASIPSDIYSFALVVARLYSPNDKWAKSDSKLAGLNFPEPVMKVLQLGLDKDPRKRPQSMEEYLGMMLDAVDVTKKNNKPQTPLPVAPVYKPVRTPVPPPSGGFVPIAGQPAPSAEPKQSAPVGVSLPLDKQAPAPVSPAPAAKKSGGFPVLPIVGGVVTLVLIVAGLMVITGGGENEQETPEVAAAQTPKATPQPTPTATAEPTPISTPIRTPPPIVATATPAPALPQVNAPTGPRPTPGTGAGSLFLEPDRSGPAGFWRVADAPPGKLPWNEPVLLFFDNGTPEARTWIDSLSNDPENGAYFQRFVRIRQTEGEKFYYAERYKVIRQPLILVTNGAGVEVGRFSPEAELRLTLLGLQQIGEDLF
ncbi:MAG: protein kinase [Candidatus Sumerlaeia bacterium]|nr:protein kinase [Candidatus Sumerlaeia bacterium]